MRWTNDELEFLATYGPHDRAIDVFQDYRVRFGDNRSYHSVQKKLRSLFEDPIEDDEDDNEEGLDTWEDALDSEGIKLKNYSYDKEADEYIIPTRRGLLHVSGGRIRQLLSEYSNYGAKKTINMVANEFGWARHCIIEVLRRLGKTHDSSPFTDEQILEEPVEELVKDMARKKENRIIANAIKQEQRKIQEDANKWRNIEHAISEVFELRDYETTKPLKSFNLKAPKKKFDALLYHTDAHVGKLAQGWEYEECRRLILETAERALSHVVRYGKPNRIITGIGGDWSNIDNPANGTTRGTLQRSNGEWFEIMEQANQIQLDLLRLYGQVAPTEAYCVPGNHDRMWSVMAGSWLAKLFENHPSVKVHTFKPRHYIESGKNMIMLTHGDGAKPKDYPSIMAAEAAEMWGRTKYRYAYHGHLHHELIREFRGVSVNQMPSVSPEDEWHVHEGYVGNRRALAAHIHDWNAGRVAIFNVAIDENNNVVG